MGKVEQISHNFIRAERLLLIRVSSDELITSISQERSRFSQVYESRFLVGVASKNWDRIFNTAFLTLKFFNTNILTHFFNMNKNSK